MRNGKLRSDREYDIVPNETDKYLFNDIPGDRSIVRRVKALQAQFPNAKNIYILSPGLDASQFVKWKDENHWTEIQDAFINLSTIYPIKIVRAPRGSGPRVADVQSIQHGCHYFSNENNFDAANGSGIYVETFRNKLVNGWSVSAIRQMYECGILDKTVKVYGVPSRFVAKLGKGWVTLKDHANAEYNAYVASIPHVIASLSNLTNEEGSIFSEISSHINDYIENNNAKLFQGKLVNWYNQSEAVRNQPDPFNTPEAKKLQAMASLTGNSVDTLKGTATLSSMKVEQHYIDVLRHLIPAQWNMPNDEKAKTLLLETVNFILKKIG
jgi:hypothetical protein